MTVAVSPSGMRDMWATGAHERVNGPLVDTNSRIGETKSSNWQMTTPAFGQQPQRHRTYTRNLFFFIEYSRPPACMLDVGFLTVPARCEWDRNPLVTARNPPRHNPISTPLFALTPDRPISLADTTRPDARVVRLMSIRRARCKSPSCR